MVFSGDPATRRPDLLEVVSVLDVDSVLTRAMRIGAERTEAGAVVLARADDGAGDRSTGDPLLVHGITVADAAALRAGLGTAGLRGGPGQRVEQDLVRLEDPATGREVLRVPVVVEGRLFADILLLDPPGGRFTDVSVESVAALGRVAGVAARNALSYTLSERRRASLELAAAVDQSVHPPFGLTEPMTRIAEGALRIVGARSCVVVSANHQGTDVAASAGTVDEVLTRTIAAVADLVRVAQEDGQDFTAQVADADVWGLPLRCEQALAGVVLLVFEPRRPRPTAADDELLTTFVRHGSLVLDHVVLQQERQHGVLAAERDRIAQDLHDVVIQRLYATALNLRVGSRAEPGAGVGDRHVSDAIREIGESIRDIRGTIFELERGRSSSLRSNALAMAREYEPVLGFVPVVRSWGPVDSLVDAHVGDQATVVLRELLSNCARHAGAGRCEVDLGVDSGWFTLQVSDDGSGIPGGDVARSGLRNIASRATSLGGDLVVRSVDPHGTRVQWRVPLEAQVVSAPASTWATADDPGEAAAAVGPVEGSGRSSVVTDSAQSHSEASVRSTQDSPSARR
ncbi:GAF domain-containing sensor histidine kinase [Mycobacterium cookii]|uniref:GAF domain-containing sensor histidine kinase n=1 Tax=Nocardioides furvisabuli TaxID=375542 RepID=A0ABP5IHJ1_9ACTN|nr:ATP-binding protein [Nocardioides furvisabuli]